MLVNKSILLILALSVAGCSNMVPMTGAADLGAAAQASAAESVVLGKETPIPEGAPLPSGDRARDTYPAHRGSEFVRLNPRLFSKAEDERPVPRVGSLEWNQLQERDAERERELRKASHICDC
jgi:hypothetical protein